MIILNFLLQIASQLLTRFRSSSFSNERLSFHTVKLILLCIIQLVPTFLYDEMKGISYTLPKACVFASIITR